MGRLLNALKLLTETINDKKNEFTFKQCIFLIKFRFYAFKTNQHKDTLIIFDKFIINNSDIQSSKWQIFNENYSLNVRSRTSQCVVWSFISPNCSINGYSQKWNCDCSVCDNKMPWFWNSK